MHLTVMMSLMPRTPCLRTSSATLKASLIGTLLSMATEGFMGRTRKSKGNKWTSTEEQLEYGNERQGVTPMTPITSHGRTSQKAIVGDSDQGIHRGLQVRQGRLGLKRKESG